MTPSMLNAIDSIYAAAEGQRSWRTALDSVASALGAAGATLGYVQLGSRTLGVVESTLFDSKAIGRYEQELQYEDPMTPTLRHVPIGTATLSHEVIDPRAWTRTRMYAELYEPASLLHAMAGTFARDGDYIGILILAQAHPGPKFTSVQASGAEILLPHFARAMRIGRALSAARADSTTSGRALLFLDRRASVVAMSPDAPELLASLDKLYVHEGELQVRDSSLARWLRQRMDDGAAPAVGESILRFRDGEASCRVELATFTDATRWTYPGPPPAFILLVERKPVTDALPASLREIAELIAEGLSDKEIAERCGRPLSTVRTYVARIYERTGLNSRSAIAKWWWTTR